VQQIRETNRKRYEQMLEEAIKIAIARLTEQGSLYARRLTTDMQVDMVMNAPELDTVRTGTSRSILVSRILVHLNPPEKQSPTQ